MIGQEGYFQIPDFWFTEQVAKDLKFLSNIWLLSFAMLLLLRVVVKKYPKYAKLFIIALMPGVIIHELSHLMMGFILRIKIIHVQLFDSETGGGSVEIDSSKRSPISNFLVVFAPLLIGSAIIYAIIQALSMPDVGSITGGLFTWVLVSVMIACAPSTQDISVAFQSLGFSWKKTVRDICIIGLSLLVYAAGGEAFASVIGTFIFSHFLLILFIQFALYLLYAVIMYAIHSFTTGVEQKRNFAESKRLIPSQIENRSVRSSLFPGSRIGSSVKSLLNSRRSGTETIERKRNEPFLQSTYEERPKVNYDEMYDDNL
jgi:hypothetical protein